MGRLRLGKQRLLIGKSKAQKTSRRVENNIKSSRMARESNLAGIDLASRHLLHFPHRSLNGISQPLLHRTKLGSELIGREIRREDILPLLVDTIWLMLDIKLVYTLWLGVCLPHGISKTRLGRDRERKAREGEQTGCSLQKILCIHHFKITPIIIYNSYHE